MSVFLLMESDINPKMHITHWWDGVFEEICFFIADHKTL